MVAADTIAAEGEASRGDAGCSAFVTAQDGLKLHVRIYGERSAPGVPVVCLPGLTRTVADFDGLASALVRGPTHSRRVIAIDSRGRGQSDYDRDPGNYTLDVELGDVVTILTAMSIEPAVIVGSSRGGLLAMKLGVVHPTLIAGVVLNDIGPVIEPKGIARLKSYVGRLPQPRSFDEGADILRRLFGVQFPKFTMDHWLADAKRTWQMKGGALTPTYDVRLARTLSGVDIERPLAALWYEFDTLARVPVLVIHGANSDILAAATVTAMHTHHPGLKSIEVPDQGHVPLLDGKDLLPDVMQFVALCEKS
jgi:pimeloyl-ACP methyl ester carboxylesterase